MYRDGELDSSTDWFYCDENCVCFLEDDKQSSKDIEKIEQINKNIKENEVKKQCLIGNSEQMKLHCKVEEDELIDI